MLFMHADYCPPEFFLRVGLFENILLQQHVQRIGKRKLSFRKMKLKRFILFIFDSQLEEEEEVEEIIIIQPLSFPRSIKRFNTVVFFR